MMAREYTGKMKVAGVIGSPIAHTLSPIIHNHWLDKYGIDGAYIPIHVKNKKDLKRTIFTLRDIGFRGVNVTLPYKEAVLDLLDEAKPIVRLVGAANTITFSEEGLIKGDNTDGFGFYYSLKKHKEPLKDAKAVVIGAGGAARAVIHELISGGVKKITIVNRTIERANKVEADFRKQKLLKKFEIEISEWKDREKSLEGAKILVNTTSLGMKGQPELDMDLYALPKNAIVYDVVYNPLKTPLLKRAEARRMQVIPGLSMLVSQAQPGFERWFKPGEFPEMDESLLKKIRNYLQ